MHEMFSYCTLSTYFQSRQALKDKNVKKEFAVRNIFRFLFNTDKTFAYVIFLTNCKQHWRGVRLMPVDFTRSAVVNREIYECYDKR